jgi:hypothetical protein
MSLGGLGTEIASEVISEIKEVLAPNLNNSITVLRSISWIDAINDEAIVISVWET